MYITKNVEDEMARPPLNQDDAFVQKTTIEGCLELRCKVFRDSRGEFVKSYSESIFSSLGVDVRFVETFYTVSEARVLRGMHFQLPPADHAKLVYCIDGA